MPRGSKEFIKYIQANTRIPVLGHSEGICHIYVDEHADLKKALGICYDAKVQYPAVCNAVETLLVHRAIAPRFLPTLTERCLLWLFDLWRCFRNFWWLTRNRFFRLCILLHPEIKINLRPVAWCNL